MSRETMVTADLQSEEIINKLDALCAKEERNRSQVIRMAINAYLEIKKATPAVTDVA